MAERVTPLQGHVYYVDLLRSLSLQFIHYSMLLITNKMGIQAPSFLGKTR